MYSRILLSFLLVTGLVQTSLATHLVGGSMSYKYIGPQFDGRVRYEVTITMYRDCAQSTVEFDKVIEMGIYHESSFSAKSLYATKSFQLLSKQNVPPPRGGSDCDFIPDVCLEKGIYRDIIDVAPSTGGYHLLFERCCRNSQKNIIDEMGQTYYAFIPPTNTKNSSPYFTEVPAPYICANDTIALNNFATDPDGDSLVYSLQHPWAGANPNEPQPSPDLTLYLPIPTVIYNPGYNYVQPFGPGGMAGVTSSNGLTVVKAPSIGRYSIAVEVKEYRKGVLLSVVRLDVQIIVILCDPNNRPYLVVGGGSGQLNHTLTAGESICFPVTVNDVDNHNLSLVAYGDIFTGANAFNPPLATLANKSGKGSVSSQFCWTPSCEQARSAPYIFTVQVTDDGCPPKALSVNYSITVNPFIAKEDITGDNVVCENTKNKVYSVPGNPDYTYEWIVSGGTLVSGLGTRSILVNWGPAGSGSVRVTPISKAGCKGLPTVKNITIQPGPPDFNITGDTVVCEFSTNVKYVAPALAGVTNVWIIDGGTAVPGGPNNEEEVNWGSRGFGSVSSFRLSANGCPSDTTELIVRIDYPKNDTLYGSPSVCPNIQGVDYFVNPPETGSTFFWRITGGTQVAGGNSANIVVNWGGPGWGKVQVVEVTKLGCIGDTVEMVVNINHNLVGSVPVGDSVVCEQTQNVKYNVIYTNHSTYYWVVTGGTIVSGAGTYSITVNWGAAGQGKITVYETSFDSITNTPCVGNVTELNVRISPVPSASNVIIGDFDICDNNPPQLYVVKGLPGSTFLWEINGNPNPPGQGNDSIFYQWTTAGTYTIRALEISKDSCIGTIIDTTIFIRPTPETSNILGDSIICFPDFSNYQYSVKGLPGSLFSWIVEQGNILTQDSSVITVNWNGSTGGRIKVIETSPFGCVGDTIYMNLFVDKPSLEMMVVTDQKDNDKVIDITWKLINAPKYNASFDILRRSAFKGGGWKLMATVKSFPGVFDYTYTDKAVKTHDSAYEYMVRGYDLCEKPIETQPHTNILLTGIKTDGYNTTLNWNQYFGWQNDVSTYELHRKAGAEQAYKLYDDLGQDTTVYYENGFDDYIQCYRVKAIENSGNNQVSWSNEVCFVFDPVLWIPNAFSPNEDNINEYFELKGGSLRMFHIDIYDRWGAKIFTSDNLKDSWDGTYNGKPVQQDAYMYMVRYSGFNNIIIQKNGTVTVLR
jgi:gliding motility-associated-like protein